MPRLRQLQTNFASGELDPLMHFRVDVGAYRNGARTLRNALIFNSGGAARRPGTYEGSQLQGASRIIPFEFASDERYVMAFSNGRLDVYDTDAALVTSVTTGCNWTTASLFEFTFAQVADTMIVAHQDWAPQVVLRTGATTFTVSDYVFDTSLNGNKTYQPYYKFADDSITLECTGTTGSVTVTASAPYFTASYVGLTLRWKDVDILITAYTDSQNLTGTIQGTLEATLDNNPFRTAEGSGTVEVTHVLHGFETGESVTLSDSGNVGGITAAQLNGAKTITVVDDNTWSFASGGTATESIDGGGPSVKYGGANLATHDWYEQAFSSIQGYPGAVCFHEGRLYFAGSSGIPDGLWSSKLFLFFNFDVGDGSTADSIQVTIGSDDISNIRHIVSNNDLQIFTASAEFVATAPRDLSLTPGNINIRRQTPYGCSFVGPLPFDGATIFLQASLSATREYIYSEATARYSSTDLNVLAPHLLSNPYDMAVLYGGTERSEQYAYLQNDDGTVAVFFSARSEQLAGWTKWEPGGAGDPEFTSVCVVGETTYFVLKRDSVYHLVKLSSDRTMTLDQATEYTDTAKSAWVVGSQYYGMTVSVTSDNYYLGDFAVDGAGNINVGEDVTNITVGYNYTFQIVTLPIDVQLQTGSTLGLPKRIVRVFVGLDSSLSLNISGNELILRQVADDIETAPAAETGTYEFRLLGIQKDAFVTLTQSTPLPATVLGMNLEVQV
jgi:hypothetical protein